MLLSVAKDYTETNQFIESTMTKNFLFSGLFSDIKLVVSIIRALTSV